MRRGLADLARHQGDEQALLHALDGLIEVAEDAAPIDTLVEAATLHAGADRSERSVELLRVALERAPSDQRVLEALSSGLQRLGRSAELADLLERRAA